MPPNGKYAQGLRGFPTPNDMPSDGGYVVFRIPKDNEYAGLILGAAEALGYAYNWYQWGDLTPDEAAEKFRIIVTQAPYDNCGCELPGGGKIIRLSTSGNLEELGDDGSWTGPTGEYAIPPITPREGGTPEDQLCLAAANAANVLEILYESITDSIAGGLTQAEAYAALVAAFVAAVGWEFAPIAFALASFFLVVFGVVYSIISVLAADLWDSTFTDTLKCVLLNCATNDEGVVSFDFECVQNGLASGTDALNFDQLRLFNQLNFIIQVIGGADGLNQAGATTAITSADCSECNPDCVFYFGGDDGGDDWAFYMGEGNGYGSYDAANDWISGEYATGSNICTISTWVDVVGSPASVTTIVNRENQAALGTIGIYAIRGDDPDDFVTLNVGSGYGNGEGEEGWPVTWPSGYDQLLITVQAISDETHAAIAQLKRVEICS